MAKIAIIYYSSTGNTYQVAQAVNEGAKAAGAETRLRRVEEIAPTHAIESNPAWKEHYATTRYIATADIHDLDWCDGYAFGTPTRFGNVSAQLKQFMDMAGPLWAQGKLANKVGVGFTGASNPNGGQESTLLALYNTLYHWGAVIVPPGYTDPLLFAAGGNPYGVSYTALPDRGVDQPTLAVARYIGNRLALYADLIAPHRHHLNPTDNAPDLVEERREEIGVGV